MPTYQHRCNECNFEWEEFYSIKAKPPTKCPKCFVDGGVERLVSAGCGRGIMRLTGHELSESLAEDAKKMSREAGSSEKTLANLVGEDKYHKNELMRDKLKREK
jgi:putative FmdB family regulatory protein